MEWGEGRERGGNEVWAWGGVVSDTECVLEPLKLESDSTVGMSHSYDASTGTVGLPAHPINAVRRAMG